MATIGDCMRGRTRSSSRRAACLAIIAAGFVAALAIAQPLAAAAASGPLTIANTASPNPVQSGAQVTFTITVANTGGAAVANAVLTDQFDGLGGVGTPALLKITTTHGSCSQNATVVTCNGGTVAGKDTWIVTVTGLVAAPNASTVNNSAFVTATRASQNYFASASTSVVVTCSAGAPPGLPDLTVDSLSVHASLPNVSGERQVTASFRIVNCGTAFAATSQTSVDSATGPTVFATPPLRPDAVAYFGTTTTTSAADFTVAVTADAAQQLQESSLANNAASYRFNAGEAAVGRWRPLGPTVIVNPVGNPAGVGRITTIAVDPSSTNTLYAGARGTGLWKTIDGGVHWEPLTDAMPTVNINAVAVDPIDPAHIFIASPAGIFGSRNGGHVWTLLSGQDLSPRATDGGALIVYHVVPVLTESSVATTTRADSTSLSKTTAAAFPFPSPFNELRLYLSTGNGLRISRDGGVTWDAPVLGGGGAIQSLLQDRLLASHLLATVSASSEAGVYETFTGGLTPDSWQKLQGCPTAPLPAFSSTMGIWVAQSGSTEWISIKTGGQHELWRTTSQTCFVNGRIERGWERLSSGDQTPCISPVSAWSFLYADPTDSRIVYKAGIRLCRSTDGGSTFQGVGGIHVDQHALAFHPTAPGLVFLGNDGGLYRSTNRGQSFAFNAEGMSVTEFLDIDHGGAPPRVILGGSQDNSISSSDETSSIWHDIPLGSDPDGDRSSVTIDPLNWDVQYTIGQAVDHFSRIEAGFRDEQFDTSGMPAGCLTYSEAPWLGTEFIATTSTDWHLLTTVGPPRLDGPSCNGGLWTGPPWRPLFAPTDGEVFTRVVHDPAVGGLFLAGGNSGSVYVNFSPDFMVKVWGAPAGGSVTSIVRDMSRAGARYFVSLDTTANNGAGRIFEISPAAPLRFQGLDVTSNLPAAYVMTLASNRFEPDVLYAGTRGQGVFRGVRNSAGEWTWRPFNNGMPQGAMVTKFRVNQTDGTIYAGTYGRGAFVLDTISIF